MKRNEVIGQDEVWQRLIEMVREGRLPHAIMLCGPQGCGKMAIALAFASYLLCQNREGRNEACGECPQCKMTENWGHPDLIFSSISLSILFEHSMFILSGSQIIDTLYPP